MAEESRIPARYQEEKSKVPVRRYVGDLYNKQQLQIAEEIVSADCEVHGFPGISESGPKGIQELVKKQHQKFPERRQDVKYLVTSQKDKDDEEYVVVRWVLRDPSEDTDRAATDGSEPIAGMTSFRITDEKISEIWVDYDILADTPVPSNVEEQEAPTSLSEIGQMLGAYILIPVTLLYPVGFLTLAFQIWAFYPLNFSTAWYATSVVPTAVVAGQGAHVLLVPLLVSLINSPLVASYLHETRSKQSERPWYKRARWWVFGLSLALFAAFAVLVFVVIAARIIGTGEDSLAEIAGFIRWAFFILPAVFSGIVGGILISADMVGNKEEKAARSKGQSNATEESGLRKLLSGAKDILSRGIRERWIFRGLLVAYAGSVLSALLPIEWG